MIIFIIRVTALRPGKNCLESGSLNRMAARRAPPGVNAIPSQLPRLATGRAAVTNGHLHKMFCWYTGSNSLSNSRPAPAGAADIICLHEQ